MRKRMHITSTSCTYLPILFFNTITHLSHSLYLTHVTLSLSFSFAYTNKNALFFSLQLIYSLPLSPTLSLCCTLSLSLSSSCIRHAWKSLCVVGQAWSESVSMRPRERAALKIDIQHWRRRRQSFSLNLRWRLSRPGLRKKWKLKFKKPTYLRVQTGSTKKLFWNAR